MSDCPSLQVDADQPLAKRIGLREVPDARPRKIILVDNPARLYGF